MTRIVVMEAEEDEYGQIVRRAAGWFNADKAERVPGLREWDGNNMACVHLQDPHRGQNLYRTAGGRYVLETWSQWQGEDTRHEFIAPERAREWLIVNGDDALAARWFGQLEEESGPGRPKIGDPFKLALPDDLRSRLEQLQEPGEPLAETMRRGLREWATQKLAERD